MSHILLKVSDRLAEAELDSAARHESEGRVRCRILAIRQLALGHSVAQVQGCFVLGKSQLYPWVQRYNAQGLAGLVGAPRAGAIGSGWGWLASQHRPGHSRQSDLAALACLLTGIEPG